MALRGQGACHAEPMSRPRLKRVGLGRAPVVVPLRVTSLREPTSRALQQVISPCRVLARAGMVVVQRGEGTTAALRRVVSLRPVPLRLRVVMARRQAATTAASRCVVSQRAVLLLAGVLVDGRQVGIPADQRRLVSRRVARLPAGVVVMAVRAADRWRVGLVVAPRRRARVVPLRQSGLVLAAHRKVGPRLLPRRRAGPYRLTTPRRLCLQVQRQRDCTPC